MIIREYVQEFRDDDKYLAPAEVELNFKTQLIRDAAIELDQKEILKTLDTPTSDAHDLFYVNLIALNQLSAHSPEAGEEVRTQMEQYDASRNLNILIPRIVRATGYYARKFVEDDNDYSPHDPITPVTEIDDRRAMKDLSQIKPRSAENSQQ